jgi:hypothetical protein
MKAPLLLLAGAVLVLAACADQTPTAPRSAGPLAPRPDLGILKLTCVATTTTTYSPGVLLTPRSVTIGNNTILAPCVSLDDPTLTSGTSVTEVVRTRSCLDPLASGSAAVTYHWNNGQSSTFTFNEVSSTTGALVTVVATGTITAGQFAGRTAVRQVTGPSLNLLDCLQEPGITSRFQTGVFEIL